MKISYNSTQMSFTSLTNVSQYAKQVLMADGIGTADTSVNPYEDPSMNVTGRTSYSLVPVSEEVTEKLKAIVKEDFIKNNGMTGEHSKRVDVKTDYIQSLPSDERINVGYTLDQITITEGRKLAEKVRASDSTWDFGKSFDPKILDDSATDKNIDILV